MKTRIERLHALIAKVAPSAAQQHAADGSWPNTHPSPGTKVNDAGATVPARHSGAPYVMETLASGKRRISLRSDDGDVYAGVGDSIDEALSMLEQKCGMAAVQGEAK